MMKELGAGDADFGNEEIQQDMFSKGKEQDLDLMNSRVGPKIMKKGNLQKTDISSLKKITEILSTLKADQVISVGREYLWLEEFNQKIGVYLERGIGKKTITLAQFSIISYQAIAVIF